MDMPLFRRKKGKKLRAETDSLLKKAERETAKAKTIEGLHDALLDITQHSIKIGEAIMEVLSHDNKLTRVRFDLANVADEIKQILAVEDPRKKDVFNLRVLSARLKALKEKEAELSAALAEFEKEEMGIEALQQQEEKLQKAAEKITARSGEIAAEMYKETKRLSEQTSLILDEALENILK
jgi:hypothetical protein